MLKKREIELRNERMQILENLKRLKEEKSRLLNEDRLEALQRAQTYLSNIMDQTGDPIGSLSRLNPAPAYSVELPATPAVQELRKSQDVDLVLEPQADEFYDATVHSSRW